jgi:L-malate glycosyltransferase
MKIGITCYPTYGGSGVVATELGIELANHGHQVHFITYSQPFRLTGREHGIFYHEVPVSNYPLFEYPPYDLALATRMSEVAAYYQLDLLHVHYAIPHSISAYLARQMLAESNHALPFVTTLHGTDITLVGLDHSYLPITRFGIDQSDGVTAISNYLREKTIKEFRTKREIEVIPNFVNCDVYTPLSPEAREAGRTQFVEPGEKILLHLSNFRPVKRAIDVVEVFARVVKEVPARLILIGDGPDRSQAEWLAQRYGIMERIHFLGKQASVNDLLPLADLMLMPSEMESFGLAALEAMACKVPSIATAVGGVPELITDGLNGRLFPVGDVEGMAAAAIDLLSNDAKHEEMAAAARQTAQQRYCASKIIPHYEAYYERVIERKLSVAP